MVPDRQRQGCTTRRPAVRGSREADQPKEPAARPLDGSAEHLPPQQELWSIPGEQVSRLPPRASALVPSSDAPEPYVFLGRPLTRPTKASLV